MLYRLKPDSHLLIARLEGELDLEMLKQAFAFELSEPEFVFIKRVFCDLRKATVNVTIEELEELVEVLTNGVKDKDFKWAIITDSPYQTVLSLLLKETDRFKNVIEVFSGPYAAADFLGLDEITKEFVVSGFKKSE